MSEPTPEPSSQPEKHPRSPIALTLQAATLIFVGGLLGLLVYRLIASERGGAVVAAIKAGRKPKAPHFDLKVIWQRPETWSPRYSTLATADRLSTDELKGMPVVINFWASWCI